MYSQSELDAAVAISLRQAAAECDKDGHSGLAEDIRAQIIPGQQSALDAHDAELRIRRDIEIAHGILCIAEGYGIHLGLKPADGFYNVTMALCNRLESRGAEKVVRAVLAEAKEWKAHRPGDGFYDRHIGELEARLAVHRATAEKGVSDGK